jgi:carbon storage regulator
MLMLSRKLGERILVPDCELVLTVLAVEGKTVRLGFSAPAEVAVHREEVWRRLSQHTEVAPALEE